MKCGPLVSYNHLSHAGFFNVYDFLSNLAVAS